MSRAGQIDFLLSGLVDGSGDPLPGRVNFYEAGGGTTRKAAYSDAQLTSPVSNPFSLSDGRAEVFAAGSYRITIDEYDTNAGEYSQILDYDNLFYGEYGSSASVWGGTSSSSGTSPIAYVITTDPLITELTAGQSIRWIPDTTNSVSDYSATLNVNSLGAKAIVDPQGNAMADSEIVADTVVEVVYDSENDRFVLSSATTVNGANITDGTITSSKLADQTSSHVFSGAFAGIGLTSTATLTATGSVVGDAADIVTTVANVAGADGAKGVKLPTAAANKFCLVSNPSPTYNVKLYPNTSDLINASSSSVAVGPECSALCFCISASQWMVIGVNIANGIVDADSLTAFTSGLEFSGDLAMPYSTSYEDLESSSSTDLTKTITVVNDTFSAGNINFILPEGVTGTTLTVLNRGTEIVDVEVETTASETINSYYVRVPLDPYQAKQFVCYDTGKWLALSGEH